MESRNNKVTNAKKGIQLSQAFGAVLTLVLVAVLVIIAIVIFVSLATSFTGGTTATVINESQVINDNGTMTINNADACGFTTWNPTTILNRTDGIGGPTNNTLVLGVDYSFVAVNGTFANLTSTYNATFVDYTYLWGSGACEASENLTVEFGNYTSLIGLIGTIIFLGLVIGVLVTAFAFGGRREV